MLLICKSGIETLLACIADISYNALFTALHHAVIKKPSNDWKRY